MIANSVVLYILLYICIHIVIHGNPTDIKAEDAGESIHPNTVRTLQRNPKFRSLFNQLGFEPKARRLATESLMNIAADARVECFATET